MKAFAAVLAAALLACSCAKEQAARGPFTIETINRYTPVKDQGRSPLCWLYAMAAVVESDRLMQGDSVNLSVAYTARRVLADRAERRYLSGGAEAVSGDGTAADALWAMAEYGVMPYDAYRTGCNFNALCRRLDTVAATAAARRTGLQRLRGALADVLDETVNTMPRRVWMYGVEYTPRQLAESIFSPGDYVALTSYTHKPFGEAVVVDVPANRSGRRFINVPLDTLVSRVAAALRSGRSVCWEGGVADSLFSFNRGVADLPVGSTVVAQAARQLAFERLVATDDHCMALIGLARDGAGRRWFVCKNSWGTANPYGGLMYMSEQYFRMYTVAVVMKKQPSDA